MKKAAFCFWLNVCLFLTFISLAFTGLVLEWGFSHGGGRGFQGGRGLLDGLTGGASRTFLGVHKSEWGEIHFIIALVLVLLAIIHIVLHWDWIVCSLKSRFFSQPDDKA
jgi:hypothetical protein